MKKQLYFIWKYIYKNIFCRNNINKIEYKKIQFCHDYLIENYSEVLDKYLNSEIEHCNSKSGFKVWVMWWQGEENMPEIIKFCFSSVKNNANGNEVILIDHRNYSEYITLPDYIIEKVEKKIISITHLSDLIRVSLLSDHGGLWLDATMLLTAPLPMNIDYSYWTTKWTLKPHEYNKYKLWVGLWSISDLPKLTISQCMGIWYSCPRNPIFQGLKDFWLLYWYKEIQVPYYWTTEVFLIGIMYGKIQSVRKMIDDVPISNSKIFDLRFYINKEFDINLWNELVSDTNFFYLSWKEEFTEYDYRTNELSFWGYLKQLDLFR
jgi:hypothetical protein